MTTATFVTNQGTFTVRLMPEHAPKTVANFIDLATGATRVDRPPRRREEVRPAVPRHDLPPGDRRLHDPGRGPDRARAPADPATQFEDECPPDGPDFDQAGVLAMANAGPGTNGSPVLRDGRRDPVAHRQAHDLRRGHRGLRRGRGDREGSATGAAGRPSARRRRDRARSTSRTAPLTATVDRPSEMCAIPASDTSPSHTVEPELLGRPSRRARSRVGRARSDDRRRARRHTSPGRRARLRSRSPAVPSRRMLPAELHSYVPVDRADATRPARCPATRRSRRSTTRGARIRRARSAPASARSSPRDSSRLNGCG